MWLPELSRRWWIVGSVGRCPSFPTVGSPEAPGPALGFRPCRPSLFEALRRRSASAGRSSRIGEPFAATPMPWSSRAPTDEEVPADMAGLAVANVRQLGGSGGDGGSWGC